MTCYSPIFFLTLSLSDLLSKARTRENGRGMVRRFGGLGTKEGGPNTAGGTLQAQAEMAMTSDVGAVVRPIATANKRMDVDFRMERDRSPVVPAAETASDVMMLTSGCAPSSMYSVFFP